MKETRLKNEVSLAHPIWQTDFGESLRGDLIFRGIAFLLGLLVLLRVATLVNPNYSLAPATGVLGGAIVLQIGCYVLLRQERFLLPAPQPTPSSNRHPRNNPAGIFHRRN